MCGPRCKYFLFSVFIVIGVSLIVAGFVIPILVESKLNAGLKQLLVVDSPNAAGFKTWINNTQPDSVPYYSNFYFFNITNADAVERGEEKPIVVEVGPYSYLKYQVKFKVSFPNDGEQNSFKTWTYYVYNPETSTGNPDDLITTVNIPYFAVKSALGTNWWQSLLFDTIASSTNSTAFVTLKASELCFGTNYPILEMVSKLQPGTPASFGLQPNATSMEEADNTTTFDTLMSGKTSLNDVNQYVEYQGMKKMSFWGTDWANEIKGTNALGYHPGVTKEDKLQTFVNDVWRSGYVVYNSTSVIQGITMYDFVLAPSQLMNATEYPPNAGFYMFSPTGMANLSAASNGAPVFVSKPHFLDADPLYSQAIEGISPADRKKHDTVIHVEPFSGVTMSAGKRLQINVKMEPTLLLYQNMTEIYMPVGWIEETSTISAPLAKQFRDTVYTALDIKKYSPLAGWIGGGVMTAASTAGLVVYAIKRRSKRSSYMRINDD